MPTRYLVTAGSSLTIVPANNEYHAKSKVAERLATPTTKYEFHQVHERMTAREATAADEAMFAQLVTENSVAYRKQAKLDIKAQRAAQQFALAA